MSVIRMRAILVYQNTVLYIMHVKTHQDNYSSCGIHSGRAAAFSLHEDEALLGASQSDFGLPVGKFFILIQLWYKSDTLVSGGFFCFPEFACHATVRLWWGFLPYPAIAFCRKRRKCFGSCLDFSALRRLGKAGCYPVLMAIVASHCL